MGNPEERKECRVKNAYGISSLARQLKAVAEKLDSLAMGVQDVEQNAPDLTGVYQNLLLDEVEHVQILTLEITKAVAEATEPSETNADEGGGSVFGPGDLTDDKSKKPLEEPAEPDQK
jgi:hypothetical protein